MPYWDETSLGGGSEYIFNVGSQRVEYGGLKVATLLPPRVRVRTLLVEGRWAM